MPYYHGNTRLNLYSASSSCYPTSDSSGKTCTTSLPPLETHGGTLTLKNNSSGHGMMWGCTNSGTPLFDQLGTGENSRYYSETDSLTYTTSPFIAQGSSIYYDVAKTTASAPVLSVKIQSLSNKLTGPDGTKYYYVNILNIDGEASTTWSTDPTYSVINIIMDRDKTATLTATPWSYNLGSSSGSASPGWGTSYSFSGSWNLSAVPDFIDLYVSINSEGSKQGDISLANGSWSGSWYSGSWKNTKITKISASKTGISFTATKSNTSRPNLSWSAMAYAIR